MPLMISMGRVTEFIDFLRRDKINDRLYSHLSITQTLKQIKYNLSKNNNIKEKTK